LKVIRLCFIILGVAVLTFAGTSAQTPLVVQPSSISSVETKDTTPVEAIVMTYPTPPSWVSRAYLSFVMQTCAKFDVPYLLVFKLIETESDWNMGAKCYNYNKTTGALLSIDYGRFQINSMNLDSFSQMYCAPGRDPKSYDIVNNSFDNAEIGIKHLADLYQQFGNWVKAVQAYNGGAHRIKTIGPRQSTINYQKMIIPIEGWWEFPPEVIVVRETYIH
jgi:hypothetical protein